MATLRNTLKAVLEADATLTGILTGGIFDADELPRTGLTPDDLPRESNGVQIKPVAVVRWRSATPYLLVQSPAGERRFVEVWFYADAGYAVVEQAKRRTKDLLNRRHLGPTTDSLGANFIVWVDDLDDLVADELQGAAAQRSRYYVQSTRL